MNRKWLAALSLATTELVALAVIAMMGLTAKADGGTATLTIKQIMDKANKGPGALFKKVVSGKADASQKKQLLDLYSALGNDDPPKGGKADWNSRTATLTKAAQAIVDGDVGAIPALKKASDCKGCHSLHQNKH